MTLKSLLVLIFVSLAFSAAFGQRAERPGAVRIAFINESYLGEREGITRLHSAYERMGMIDCLPSPCGQKERSQWEAQLVAPVLREIADSLKRTAAHNNMIILKLSDLEKNGRLLALDRKVDITKRFAAFFNSKSNASDDLLALDVPLPKIGVIDTDFFGDGREGINRLIKANGFDPKKVCADPSICEDIGNALQDYADRRGFSFVLDSSKGLPEGLSEFKTEDITRNFISEYNRKTR